MAGSTPDSMDAALAIAQPVVAAAVGIAAPQAVPLAGALLDAFGRVFREAYIAHAAGEVLTGAQLVARSAERLALAAADPALPPEARAAVNAP